MCEVKYMKKMTQQKEKKKLSTAKWSVMNPISCEMKKRSPFSEQNRELVHWWLLVHSGR